MFAVARLINSVQETALATLECLPDQCARQKQRSRISERMALRILSLMSPRFPTAATTSAPQLGPLIQILEGQSMQHVLFPLQEVEEPEVRLGPIGEDGARRLFEDLLTPPRAILEEPEAPVMRRSHGDAPQPPPSDALNEVGAEGLVVEARGADGHVGGAPSNVGQAPVADIAWAEVLEVLVNAGGALVFAASVSCACDDIIGTEAHTTQLLLEDPADIGTLLASAMHDVSEHGGACNRW